MGGGGDGGGEGGGGEGFVVFLFAPDCDAGAEAEDGNWLCHGGASISCDIFYRIMSDRVGSDRIGSFFYHHIIRSIAYHIISYDIIPGAWYDASHISCRVIILSYFSISSNIISYHSISSHLISYHIKPSHIATYNAVSCTRYTISHDIISHLTWYIQP